MACAVGKREAGGWSFIMRSKKRRRKRRKRTRRRRDKPSICKRSTFLGLRALVFHTWVRMCLVKHKSDRRTPLLKTLRWFPLTLKTTPNWLPVTATPHLIWYLPASPDASKTTVSSLNVLILSPPLHLLCPPPGKRLLHFLVCVAFSHR